MADDAELEQTIREQVDEWSSNSNECLNIALVRANGEVHAEFTPNFTYPIFGDDEAIFGYRDLAIDLTFAAHDMQPRVRIESSKTFKAIGDIKPTDIKESLADFLPEEAWDEGDGATDAKSFKPPGEKIHSYRRDGKNVEIWCASLADPAAKQLLENMQILVPMFIEGGTTLQLEQDWTTQRWKIFLLYSVIDSHQDDNSPYALVGYGTSYRLSTLPDRAKPDPVDVELLTSNEATKQQFFKELSPDLASTLNNGAVKSPFDLPSRERLSQFLILPPFQGGGHGQELYNTMYSHLTAPANVREFTVEDPNEAFDDLRDVCDMCHLRRHYPDFNALRVNIDIPAAALAPKANIPLDLIISGEARDKIRRQAKMDKRQFGRLVEMHTLSFIPPLHRSKNRITKKENSTNPNDKAYFLWRLYAKHRIYVHNRDQLLQLDAEERPEKVEGALDAVLEGYTEGLERIERAMERAEQNGNGEAEAVGGAKRNARKRKVVNDEDDDDDEAVDNVGLNGSRKKAKA